MSAVNLDDQIRRYFGALDLAAVTPAALNAGIEHMKVDLGLTKDTGQRFALWTGARSVLENYCPHIAIDPTWPIEELGSVCSLYQPQTITQNDLVEDGAYLVYGANGVIGRYGRYNHEQAEVLVTCRGATCGTVNYSTPKSWITGNAMVASPKGELIDKDFLFYFLRGSDLSSTITGSAQPQITRQGLSPYKIPVPPRETQRALVADLEAERTLVEGNRELIARMERRIEGAIARLWGDASVEQCEAIAAE